MLHGVSGQLPRVASQPLPLPLAGLKRRVTVQDQRETNDTGKSAEEETPKKPNILDRIETHIQSNSLRGFIALIPLLVSGILVLFFVGKADGYVRQLPFVEGRPWDFLGIGLIVIVVVFYLVGLADSTPLGHKFMLFKDAVLSRIPLVKTFYQVTQQAVRSLTSSYTFTRVVFVEWPRDGMVAMGFVTGRVYSKDKDESLAVVYIPTVPNPTSGNMAFVHEDDVMETNINVDDAMRLVFSGGIVLPKELTLARAPREQQTEGAALVGQYQPFGRNRT